MWPDPQRAAAIHARMRAAAQHFRLPLRSNAWRGQAGNWLGAGVGSSIDFQDHRPYMPGDDPRYIDWQAYGRTGHYTMKLYREEVSPQVDLVLDVSPSMFVEAAKAERTCELFYLCVESALESGAALRCWAWAEKRSAQWPVEAVLGYAHFDSLRYMDAELAPMRQGSLRVLISDLLYPGSPAPLLQRLASGKGRGVIFAPFSRAESEPDWSGNVEFADCETLRTRVQHVSDQVCGRYRDAYARHFDMWKEHARKHAVALARVAGEPDLHLALRAEALPFGAIDVR